jgi:hypothetical protein
LREAEAISLRSAIKQTLFFLTARLLTTRLPSRTKVSISLKRKLRQGLVGWSERCLQIWFVRGHGAA